MSWKAVIDCLRAGEGPQVEFLTRVASAEELVRYCVSFLNQSGGTIIIGIDDKNNHLVGSNISKNFIELAIQKIDPAPHIEIEEINRLDKLILYITVPEGSSKPYSYRNKYYNREGAETKRMNKEEANHLAGEQKKSLLNKRQEKVLTYLKDHDSITNRMFRDLHGVSHKTAHIELTELADQQLITKFGLGRNTAYKLG